MICIEKYNLLVACMFILEHHLDYGIFGSLFICIGGEMSVCVHFRIQWELLADSCLFVVVVVATLNLLGTLWVYG